MTLTEDLLKRGLTDVIQLSEMAGVARRHGFKNTEEVRYAVLESLEQMLRSGWISLGDAVMEKGVLTVRQWELAPDSALARIREEWKRQPELRPGDVCWFELTEAGRKAAEDQ